MLSTDSTDVMQDQQVSCSRMLAEPVNCLQQAQCVAKFPAPTKARTAWHVASQRTALAHDSLPVVQTLADELIGCRLAAQ